MHEYAEIVGYRHSNKGTELKVTIPDKELGDYIKRFNINGIVPVELRLNDGRSISADQRKKIYATIRDISDHTGHAPEELKELLKYYYMAESGEEYFSFSNCSVTVARLFINFLIEFAFYWDIPLMDTGLNRTDDISKYLWLCIKFRKCCICGKPGEIHHVDTIGIGRDRTKVDDSNYKKIALCRIHHTEAHVIGKDSFENKYHVYGVTYKED